MESIANLESALPWLAPLYTGGPSFAEMLTRPEGFNGPTEGEFTTLTATSETIVALGRRYFKQHRADFVSFVGAEGKWLRHITRQHFDFDEPSIPPRSAHVLSDHCRATDWITRVGWIIVEVGVWSSPYHLHIYKVT